MATTEGVKLDAGSLLWGADRLSLYDIDEGTRTIVEGIARHLEEVLPTNDDGEFEPAEVDENEIDELRTEVATLSVDVDSLEGVLTLVEQNLDVVLATNGNEDEPAIDVARVVADRLKKERDEGVKDATIPSRANTAQRKAMRLLVEGRVVVKRIDVDGPKAMLVVAEVRGDSGDTYTCGHDPQRRQWRCTCPEMRGDCSHIAAVKMVTSIPRGDH